MSTTHPIYIVNAFESSEILTEIQAKLFVFYSYHKELNNLEDQLDNIHLGASDRNGFLLKLKNTGESLIAITEEIRLLLANIKDKKLLSTILEWIKLQNTSIENLSFLKIEPIFRKRLDEIDSISAVIGNNRFKIHGLINESEEPDEQEDPDKIPYFSGTIPKSQRKIIFRELLKKLKESKIQELMEFGETIEETRDIDAMLDDLNLYAFAKINNFTDILQMIIDYKSAKEKKK